jgi:hypothetical protein
MIICAKILPANFPKLPFYGKFSPLIFLCQRSYLSAQSSIPVRIVVFGFLKAAAPLLAKITDRQKTGDSRITFRTSGAANALCFDSTASRTEVGQCTAE